MSPTLVRSIVTRLKGPKGSKLYDQEFLGQGAMVAFTVMDVSQFMNFMKGPFSPLARCISSGDWPEVKEWLESLTRQ